MYACMLYFSIEIKLWLLLPCVALVAGSLLANWGKIGMVRGWGGPRLALLQGNVINNYDLFLEILWLQKNYKVRLSYFYLFGFCLGCFFLNLVLLFSFSRCLEKYYLKTKVLNIILFIASRNSSILPKPHCFCFQTSLEHMALGSWATWHRKLASVVFATLAGVHACLLEAWTSSLGKD